VTPEENAILDRLDFDLEYDLDVDSEYDHFHEDPLLVEVEYETVAEVTLSERTVAIIVAVGGLALTYAWTWGLIKVGTWVVRSIFG
jgi:hypothetical protein